MGYHNICYISEDQDPSITIETRDLIAKVIVDAEGQACESKPE